MTPRRSNIMTTYTAEDFKRAEFATRDASYIARHAMRCNENSPTPWQGQYGTWSDNQMAEAGWVPVEAGSYTRTESPDLMDGGVTSALVEEEADAAYTRTDEDAALRLAAEQIAEAQAEATAAVTAMEKAEQERDVWKATAQETGDSIDALLAEQPRPLTPDDITDRFVDHVHEDYFWSTEERVRLDKRALRDALRDAVKRSQQPTRPEGAEDIERELAYGANVEGLELDALDDAKDAYRALADHLASRGVRVAPIGLTPTNPEKETR